MPGATEDDGYVFAYVHNPDRGASGLVILAAQDFTAEPVARVHLPAPIPLGFHGSWLADHDHERDRQRQTGPGARNHHPQATARRPPLGTIQGHQHTSRRRI